MRKIIGVSLTDDSLEASVVGYSLRMVKPLKVFSLDLPAEKEEKHAFLVETFKEWKQQYAPAGITVGLPLKHFLSQSVDMPVMKKQDMRKALSFELEKYLPLAIDEYFFDFFCLAPDGKHQKVVVLAAKKELIQSLAAAVSEAGLPFLSITCNSLCALSGVQEIAGEKNLQGLFIHALHDGCEVAGLKGSEPVMLRSYPKCPALHDEIEKLLTQYPGKVYITGKVDQLSVEKIDIRKFRISVAHAVASSSMRNIPFRLNFLPPELAAPKKDYYPYLLGGIAAASVLFFILGGLVRYSREYTALRSIESRIAMIKQKASPVIEAQKKLDALQSDRKVLIDFQKKSNTATKVLSDLSKLLPKDAWIVNFSVDDKGKVEVEGFAARATRLVIDLENSNVFRNVTFSSPIVAKDGEERFSIKMEEE